MASNVLPLFWDLASSSRDTRLSASVDLVAAAQSFQAAYTAPKPKSDEEDDDEDEESGEEDDGDESGMEVDASDDEGGMDGADPAAMARLDKALARDNAPDVVYCVKRLVRGLGSSRESSRLGFAVALTEVSSSGGRVREGTKSESVGRAGAARADRGGDVSCRRHTALCFPPSLSSPARARFARVADSSSSHARQRSPPRRSSRCSCAARNGAAARAATSAT